MDGTAHTSGAGDVRNALLNRIIAWTSLPQNRICQSFPEPPPILPVNFYPFHKKQAYLVNLCANEGDHQFVE